MASPICTGILVISESRAAHEQLKTVRRILGDRAVRGVIPLTIKSQLSARTLKSNINAALKKIKSESVLILAELYGSTQCNVCLDFLTPGQIEMVSGYNMAMLIKAAMLNQKMSIHQLQNELCDAAKKYVQVYNECPDSTHHAHS